MACASRGLLLVLVAGLCLHGCAALRKPVSLEDAQDVVATDVIQDYGMAAGGVLEAELTVTPGQRAFLVLFPSSDWDSWTTLLNGVQTSRKRGLCEQPSSLRYELSGTTSISGMVGYRDQYTAVIVCCSGSHVGVEGWIALRNPSLGSDLQHFAVELAPSVKITVCLLVAYTLLAGLWVSICYAQRPNLRNIHHLCTVAIALKVVDQVCALGYLHDFGQHGENTSALFVVRQIVGSVSATTFLSVLLLIAQGWSLTRARLSRRELRIMLAMIAVYLTIGIMKAFCNDGDRLCGAYLLTEYVVRSLVMLGIIVAMNFNITHLRTSVHDGPWAPSLPAAYRHLRHFQQFRWAFLAYLLLPTILLIVKITVLTWRFEWVAEILRETLVLYIYVHVGVTFRPTKRLTFEDIANGNRAAIEQQTTCPDSDDDDSTPNLFPPSSRSSNPPHALGGASQDGFLLDTPPR